MSFLGGDLHRSPEARAHPRQGPLRLLPVRGVLWDRGLLGEPRLLGDVRALRPRGSRLPSPRLLPRRPRGGAGGRRGGLLLPVAPGFLRGRGEAFAHAARARARGADASHQIYLPLGLRLVFLGWATPTRLGGCLHLDDQTTIHVQNSLRW